MVFERFLLTEPLLRSAQDWCMPLLFSFSPMLLHERPLDLDEPGGTQSARSGRSAAPQASPHSRQARSARRSEGLFEPSQSAASAECPSHHPPWRFP